MPRVRGLNFVRVGPKYDNTLYCPPKIDGFSFDEDDDDGDKKDATSREPSAPREETPSAPKKEEPPPIDNPSLNGNHGVARKPVGRRRRRKKKSVPSQQQQQQQEPTAGDEGESKMKTRQRSPCHPQSQQQEPLANSTVEKQDDQKVALVTPPVLTRASAQETEAAGENNMSAHKESIDTGENDVGTVDKGIDTNSPAGACVIEVTYPAGDEHSMVVQGADTRRNSGSSPRSSPRKRQRSMATMQSNHSLVEDVEEVDVEQVEWMDKVAVAAHHGSPSVVDSSRSKVPRATKKDLAMVLKDSPREKMTSPTVSIEDKNEKHGDLMACPYVLTRERYFYQHTSFEAIPVPVVVGELRADTTPMSRRILVCPEQDLQFMANPSHRNQFHLSLPLKLDSDCPQTPFWKSNSGHKLQWEAHVLNVIHTRQASMNPDGLTHSALQHFPKPIELSLSDGVATELECEPPQTPFWKSTNGQKLLWEARVLNVVHTYQKASDSNELPHSPLRHFVKPVELMLSNSEAVNDQPRLALRLELCLDEAQLNLDEPVEILGTLEDVMQLHCHYNTGAIPESVVAWLILEAMRIVSILHTCNVTHNDLGLDSFLLLRTKKRQNEGKNGALASAICCASEWVLLCTGLGTKSHVLGQNTCEQSAKKVTVERQRLDGAAKYTLPASDERHTRLGCRHWHFENDLYGIANVAFLLLSGGVPLSWRISSEREYELEWKSLITGNHYLRGSLAWEELFHALINPPGSQCGMHCVDWHTVLQGAGEADKGASDKTFSTTSAMKRLSYAWHTVFQGAGEEDNGAGDKTETVSVSATLAMSRLSYACRLLRMVANPGRSSEARTLDCTHESTSAFFDQLMAHMNHALRSSAAEQGIRRKFPMKLTADTPHGPMGSNNACRRSSGDKPTDCDSNSVEYLHRQSNDYSPGGLDGLPEKEPGSRKNTLESKLLEKENQRLKRENEFYRAELDRQRQFVRAGEAELEHRLHEKERELERVKEQRGEALEKNITMNCGALQQRSTVRKEDNALEKQGVNVTNRMPVGQELNDNTAKTPTQFQPNHQAKSIIPRQSLKGSAGLPLRASIERANYGRPKRVKQGPPYAQNKKLCIDELSSSDSESESDTPCCKVVHTSQKRV